MIYNFKTKNNRMKIKTYLNKLNKWKTKYNYKNLKLNLNKN